MLSHRLLLTINQRQKIVFGSVTNIDFGANEEFVCLKAAGILPLHCYIYAINTTVVVLEVIKDALVCVNGHRILDVTHKFKDGDHVLLGKSALFTVCFSYSSKKKRLCAYPCECSHVNILHQGTRKLFGMRLFLVFIVRQSRNI